jgi:metal-responsive CopG/Arc/MetJ family transcriptional regulator
MYMKAIQITLDEKLLDLLDRDNEVKKKGRSAVIRHALVAYLGKKRRESVADSYRRGYAKEIDSELSGWADEGVWPPK